MNNIQILQQRQSLDLDLKIKLSERRIREWISHWGENKVYVSFSGGKDSMVLLDIVRKLYPNVKAVFVDTGLESLYIVTIFLPCMSLTFLTRGIQLLTSKSDHGYNLK